MDTAIETRDVLSKLDGVLRVHPNGVTAKALIYVRGKSKVTEDMIGKALQGAKKLSLKSVKNLSEKRDA